MAARHPPPRLWLVTDERQGEALWPALNRLPPGAGILFRHYSLSPAERKALFARVQKIARRQRLLLILAGREKDARAWQAAGWHGKSFHRTRLIRTASAHNLRETRAAERARATLIFVSPVFETRSHPGGRTLGPVRFAMLARSTRLPVVALGGMNSKRARQLAGAYGWAAIDAWSSAPA